MKGRSKVDSNLDKRMQKFSRAEKQEDKQSYNCSDKKSFKHNLSNEEEEN
jgi:hypothetical protein